MAARQVWRPPSSNGEQDLHEWALRMWRRMDRDNNGCLSRLELDCEEFHSIIGSLFLPTSRPPTGFGGPIYARAAIDMDQAIGFVLRKADCNNDGKLSFDEFKAFMLVLRQPMLATHTANLVFALFDINRDGFVDEYEFRQIHRYYLGRNPTEAEFQEEWERLDYGNRGQISKDDYSKWLQTSSNPIFQQHGPRSKVMSADSAKSAKSTDLTQLVKTDSGSFSYQLAKKEPTLADCTGAARPSSSAEAAPWRPWHAYSNMCWAKVQQLDPKAETKTYLSQSDGFANAVGQDQKMRISRSAGSVIDRPSWNKRLATANTNWPDKYGRCRRPKSMRSYCGAPQSMAELHDHYNTNPGFESHLRSIQQPDLKFHQNSKFSTDRIEARTAPQLLPGRSKFNYGRMKNPQTGKRQDWEDNWGSPPQIRDKYVAGSNSLRCLGAPPRFLSDEYEDPPEPADSHSSCG